MQYRAVRSTPHYTPHYTQVLRERMLHLDKAVDPRSLGFFTFGAFLAASRMVSTS